MLGHFFQPSTPTRNPEEPNSDGTIYGWGEGDAGAELIPVARPVPWVSEQHFSRVAAGEDFTIAVREDGAVISWGSNDSGQLGDGTTTDCLNNYVVVTGVSNPTWISAQQFSSESSFALAVVGGQVKAWGENSHGQLGDGTVIDRTTAITISGLENIVEVACGPGYGLALDSNGSVWAWGSFWGLGDGTTVDRLTPGLVPGLANVIHIASESSLSWAIAADGSVWKWGLGGGVVTPTLVSGIVGAVKIIPGILGTFALLGDGRVFALTGSVRFLGLPGGLLDQIETPTQIPGIVGAVDMAVGGDGKHVRLGDGTILSWGYSLYLGNGSSWSNKPVTVLGLAGATESLSTLGTFNSQDSWLLSNFSFEELLDPNIFPDTADPDGDGINNLLEYALGLDPRAANGPASLPTQRIDFIGVEAQSESAGGMLGGGEVSLFALPTVDLTGGKNYMALTVERHGDIRQDIDYIVEVSPDLENWLSGDPHTVTVLDTAETLEVYDATAMEDALQRFMRLKIQRR